MAMVMDDEVLFVNIDHWENENCIASTDCYQYGLTPVKLVMIWTDT